MYSEQLEKLIDLAITDGNISEKERQVLYTKAQEQGIDLNEFEVVLEAKLYQKQQSIRNTSGPSREERLNLHKCPNCGDIPPGISKICPSCGFIFSKESDQNELDRSMRTLRELLLELRNFPRLSYTTTGKCVLLAAGILFICFCLNKTEIKASSIVALLGVGGYYIFKQKGFDELLSVIQNDKFEYTLERIDSQSRSIQTAYGQNSEVKNLLEELDTEREKIIRERKKSRNLVFGLILVIVGLTLISLMLAAVYDFTGIRKTS